MPVQDYQNMSLNYSDLNSIINNNNSNNSNSNNDNNNN